MKSRLVAILLCCVCCSPAALATKLFIPMDAEGQTNHLKAYGIAFAALRAGIKVDWFLNYKGGSFGMEYSKAIADSCAARGVSCTKMKDIEYKDVVKEVGGLKYDGEVVQLVKAPKIAVYTPLNKEPWDDAVTLALTFAEIPFDKIYVNEVLENGLDKYDWLHLHHEDFTGQYGKFWNQFRGTPWYQADQLAAERMASKHGFKKVQQMQLAVVKKIRAFVGAGGNMFAMCSATDTYDIALASDGIDICETQFDGDPMDTNAQAKLNFTNCFAFRNFNLETSPYVYEYSSIDNTDLRKVDPKADFFTLNAFPPKLDIVPTMLCQNHTTQIKGFMGQTTAFRNEVLKPGVLVMAGNSDAKEARYIHGDYGRGTWTFYGGHDPEDYRHAVNAPPTNLQFYTASPGYRLILNNVLCPAAKKQDVPLITLGKQNTETTPTAPAAGTTRIKIAPNPDPATNEIIITVPDGMAANASKSWNVTVKNPAGVDVINKNYTDKTIHLDLKELPSGAYLIQVNGTYAGKVMKD